MERTASEVSERIGDLEEKCRQLERETRWWRRLIVVRREKGRREREREA